MSNHLEQRSVARNLLSFSGQTRRDVLTQLHPSGSRPIHEHNHELDRSLPILSTSGRPHVRAYVRLLSFLVPPIPSTIHDSHRTECNVNGMPDGASLAPAPKEADASAARQSNWGPSSRGGARGGARVAAYCA